MQTVLEGNIDDVSKTEHLQSLCLSLLLPVGLYPMMELAQHCICTEAFGYSRTFAWTEANAIRISVTSIFLCKTWNLTKFAHIAIQEGFTVAVAANTAKLHSSQQSSQSRSKSLSCTQPPLSPITITYAAQYQSPRHVDAGRSTGTLSQGENIYALSSPLVHCP